MITLLKIMLLDVGLPVASWLAIVISIMIALLGFLIKDAYTRMNTKIDNLSTRCTGLENQVVKANSALAAERNRIDEELRKQDNKINDLKSNIIDRLQDIKDEFIKAKS